MKKKKYMRMAINLARLGQGRVNPNPLVGAIIVKDGRIIGQGYHRGYGMNHAEVEAFESLKESAEGAEMYVNLEPCSHYGKTPPCAERIVREKIGKVYVAMEDPNPRVAGRGIEILRQNGIEVELGILEEEARRLNEVFIHYIKKGTPMVIMKFAMSLDGKIATKDFQSKWISNESSRLDVAKLRNQYMGIMVGSNTLAKDDPRLTSRIEGGRDPYKIIVDSKLRLPLDARVLTINPEKALIFTTEARNREKEEAIRRLGGQVHILGSKEGQVDLVQLMGKVGKLGIDSILLEGGGNLNFSCLKDGLVDKVLSYIAPKIIGGRESITPVTGEGVGDLAEHFKLDFREVKNIDGDLFIESYVRK